MDMAGGEESLWPPFSSCLPPVSEQRTGQTTSQTSPLMTRTQGVREPAGHGDPGEETHVTNLPSEGTDKACSEPTLQGLSLTHEDNRTQGPCSRSHSTWVQCICF